MAPSPNHVDEAEYGSSSMLSGGGGTSPSPRTIGAHQGAGPAGTTTQLPPFPTLGGTDNNQSKFGTSWLSGLGLAGSSPSSTRRASAIADDIRNDRELFFPDDRPPTPPTQHQQPPSTGQSSHRPTIGPRSRRRSSTGVALPRGSSQTKMQHLQREVDLALEYFSQETEHELDDFDGDEYLKQPEKYQRVGGDESDGTAATSLANSIVTDYDNECSGDWHNMNSLSLSEQSSTVSDQHQQIVPTRMPLLGAPVAAAVAPFASGSLSLQHKTKSILTLPLMLLPSRVTTDCSEAEDDVSIKFEDIISQELKKTCITDDQGKNNNSVDFISNSSLRNAMEPFLAVARLRREEARQSVFDTLHRVVMPQGTQGCASRRASISSVSSELSFHVGSTYGVPYPTLRNESSFLYDVESFPLGQVLAETLGVDDLSKLHVDHPLVKDKERLMATLLSRGKRRKFHQCFDSFVISQVIPLLHSQALSKGVFYTNRHQLQKGQPQSIIYRYQAFPCINIVRPGECMTDPHCDIAQGHSIGNINFHIPLTATFGTNAIYTESRPGREDWHPLQTKSPGLGFQYDGARCLHFALKNETDITRVSLNFRIAITRASADVAYDPDDQLCCPELLKDKFSLDNPGFYDEVVVNVGDVPRSFLPGPLAVKRKGGISVVG